MPLAPATRNALFLTVAASLGYLLVLWLIFSNHMSKGLSVMSCGFLFAAPFASGALVNRFAEPDKRGSFRNLVLLPSAQSVLAVALAFLFHIDGIICLIMALPAYVVMASLGAVAHHLATRNRSDRAGRRGIAAFLLLPIVIGPIEGRLGAAPKYSATRTQIEIAAPAAAVWKNVIRVPRIAPGEIPAGLSRWMGFPDPVEATLSREGVGGVRRASFQGNVLFTETIDAWIDRRLVSFTIVPNTAEIPPTTMDEHMIVGGRFFNVLRGTYEIEELGAGRCLLRLRSDHVAVTDFNVYADLWGRLVMADIQGRILKVIKARSEREGG